jgi:hypothetical protein
VTNTSVDDFIYVLEQARKLNLMIRELRVRDVSASFFVDQDQETDAPSVDTDPTDLFNDHTKKLKKELETDMFLSSG